MASSILRLPAVVKITGLSRSSIYLRILSGAFPRPVSLGARAADGAKATSMPGSNSFPKGFRRAPVRKISQIDRADKLNQASHGGMCEWLKQAVLKTALP
jgi:prophage regulatory protein